MRPSGRFYDEMRIIEIKPGFSYHAEGSVFIKIGQTEVLCTASIDERVPPFLRNQGTGWVTAEYGMLPRATHVRTHREASKGKQSGRTQEIQRLIARSIRAVVNLKSLGERTITLDCDVLNADGGTRCASITGAWTALMLAVQTMIKEKKIAEDPIIGQVAAVSCGITNMGAVLDLDYREDSSAYTDANFILTKDNKIIEIQATAEKEPFTERHFTELLKLAHKGVNILFDAQLSALQ